MQSAVNEGRNWKHELDTCTTSEIPAILLFVRVVTDNWPSVNNPSTVNGSRHNNAVKGNHARDEKIKNQINAKLRAIPTELKTVGNVLIKHTIKKDKLTSYWGKDLFAVAKMNRAAIIVTRKRDGKVFARNI